jgi:hypothetical protein
MGKDWKRIIGNLKSGNLEPFIYKAHKKYYQLRDHKYTPIWEKDWDFLLIMDGCRLDYAKEEFTGDKYHVESTIAPGSSSREWAEHFSEAPELHDIVYVSANPHISNEMIEELAGQNPFFMIYDVWKSAWDEELGTVKAEDLNEKLRKVKEMHPDKRIVAHYMQPHHPFIGEKRIDEEGFRFPGEMEEEKHDLVWDKIRDGEITVEEAQEAYRFNLKYIKAEIEDIVPELEGKTILTADHGNLFGERGMYAHPPGMQMKELVEVPWIEVE